MTKATDLRELAPAHIRSIAPYQPGKPISELVRELGIDESTIVKLASNENPRGIGPRTRAAIDAALEPSLEMIRQRLKLAAARSDLPVGASCHCAQAAMRAVAAE